MRWPYLFVGSTYAIHKEAFELLQMFPTPRVSFLLRHQGERGARLGLPPGVKQNTRHLSIQVPHPSSNLRPVFGLI